MYVRTLFEFLLISTSVCAAACADTYRSGWREVHLLCQPFEGKHYEKMINDPAAGNGGFTDANFIPMPQNNYYGCWDLSADSRYEKYPGIDACSSLNTFFFLNSDGTVNETIGCNMREFYTRRKQNLYSCKAQLGSDVTKPKKYFITRDYDSSTYICSQKSNDGRTVQTTRDGRKFVLMEDEYLCLANKKDFCVNPKNKLILPIGFSAKISKDIPTISPSEYNSLPTRNYVKSVTTTCTNIGGQAQWKYTINECKDGYDLISGKCVKKTSSTTPVKPTPDEDTPPTKPNDGTEKPRMEPLQPLPPLPNPGAVVQNPITIENPNLPKPPKLPVLDDDIEIIDEEIEIEDDLFKELEQDDLHILPILSPDIEIEDEEIVIEDDLFKELEQDTIVVPELDPDYAARVVCKKKTGAFWNALARECQCIDEKNTEWNADKSACVETAAARAARLAAEAQARIDNAYNKISSANELLANTLTTMDISKWKTEEGKFNTSRLASDSIAGVVLGTAGGLITSTVVKKQQVKQGFEDIECTIGGQSVASFGDQFTVGVK